MTPELRGALPPVVLLDEDPLFDVVSMTFCATHSPNVHPLNASPPEPKTCSIVSCWKVHAAVLFSAEGASQEIPRWPLSVLMMPVRSKVDCEPQNVPDRHVHFRFWQFQFALPSPSPRSCVHESALQKNCSTP